VFVDDVHTSRGQRPGQRAGDFETDNLARHILDQSQVGYDRLIDDDVADITEQGQGNPGQAVEHEPAPGTAPLRQGRINRCGQCQYDRRDCELGKSLFHEGASEVEHQPSIGCARAADAVLVPAISYL
jgi:hypothetical protein